MTSGIQKKRDKEGIEWSFLMIKIGSVSAAMIAYYRGDPRRINHFLKVSGFARTIGEMEHLDQDVLEILELAALTHDIGIKVSEEKYQSCAGNFQQTEGPPVAKEMLTHLGFQPDTIERVCWLIAHHHDYQSVQELDHQILIEADFLVNAFEGNLSTESIHQIYMRIFKTKTGKIMLEQVFGLHECDAG
jgi:HD superfamily phosphodiesterase